VSSSHHAGPPSAQSTPLWRSFGPLAIFAVAVLAGLAAALWLGAARRSAGDGPATLTVFVRPNADAKQPLNVEDAGALPVRVGGSMTLEIRLKEPAFLYLVWQNSEGKVLPLYPWNTDRLEVTDISGTPPQRRASKVLFSPLQLGGGWAFGVEPGMETVLLLTRDEALPENFDLGKQLADLPPASAPRQPEEIVVLSVPRRGRTVKTLTAKNRGNDKAGSDADAALKEVMLRLAKDFDLVHAVRFTHAEPQAETTP
jgi:hypothetical protein